MLIRTKIVLSCVCSVAVASAAVLTVLKREQVNLSAEILKNASQTAEAEAGSIASGVYRMVHAQNQLLQQKVNADLNVARDQLASSGGVHLDGTNPTEWAAVNQYTKQSSNINIPTMMVGERAIVPNRSFESAQPVVDEVQEMVGGTATIFQRINEAGDMLRVATNVRKADGERAVGTFIPATNPDGAANPVVSTIMKGETFYGRAYVVNAWYITAYEPIKDVNDEIIGVLYVGVKQESVDSLRHGIMDFTIGDSGYVFVIGGSGNQQGQYIISKNGKRDGENIWDAIDSEGNLFIRNIVESAKGAKGTDPVFVRYPWQNEGESKARYKVSACIYYEPWDWVIGAGTYEDEYFESVASARSAINHMVVATLIIAVVSCIASAFVIFYIASKVTQPIKNMTETLRDLADGDGDLTERIEAHSKDEMATLARSFNTFVDKIHDLVTDVRRAAFDVVNTADSINRSTTGVASAASEQSSQTIQIASAVEEMSASVIDIAKQSTEAANNADASGREAQRGAEIVEQTVSGMRDIADVVNTSADSIRSLGERTQQIDEIIGVINDIADQTNLLALNAAIEAARAGEHGRGFAVVADEVRKLADRTTQATEEISESIRVIQDDTLSVVKQMSAGTERVEQGVELASRAGEALSSIQSVVLTVSGAIQSIAAAGEQQSVASGEIAASVETLNQSTNLAVESTNHSSQAVSSLTDRAEQLQQLVSRFKLREDS